jgi:endo-1,4-beta-xylanase
MMKTKLQTTVWFLCAVVVACSTSEMAGPPALKEVFKDSYHVGTALNLNQITGQESEALALVVEQFNSITAENALKWERVHPNLNEYNFEPTDKFVALGEKHKMFIIGHVLVWHSQTPEWVFQNSTGDPLTRDELLQRMQEHIVAVAGRYKGRIHGWDVVNEAFEDDGAWRNTKWRKIIGDDYIQKAFEFARQADPEAELYYNDYNMWKPGKVQSVVKLVQDLHTKGVTIDGIGMQGHWALDYPPLDEVEEAIKAFAGLGLKVVITELDVNVLPNPGSARGADISLNYELQKKLNPYSDGLPDSMQTVLAERYADFFRVFQKYRENISRVTFWGVHDGQSWHNNWPVKGRTAHSLLFDRQYKPKPAFEAVLNTATTQD